MPRTRDATTARRKEAQKKNAQELATRCDDVAVVRAASGGSLVWPSNQAVWTTVGRYNPLPPEERARQLKDSADHLAHRLEEEHDKLVRAQEGGVAGAFGSRDGSLAAAQSRALVRQLQSGGAPDRDSVPPRPMHADEVTAGTSVSVRARGASNGARRRRRGKADAGGDVSALPLGENPKAPNAAALVASKVTAESSVPAPTRGAGNGARRRRRGKADAGGDVSALPLGENPKAPNAAALVASKVTAESSVPAPTRGAGNGARRRRRGKADAGGDVSAPPLGENPKAPNAAALVADKVTAESSVPAPTRGAGNGVRRRPQGKADVGGDVSAPPLEENPKAPNAAALVAGKVMTGSSVPAPTRGAGNGVRRRLFEVDAREIPLEANPGTPNATPLVADKAAKGGDESEHVQILPVPGDADDAEWTRDLVEALKEKPPPSSAAAPYWTETEYLYMGGGAIERDAYDFICFDLEMPPAYIGPDSPDSDDDEPLKLWSWE